MPAEVVSLDRARELAFVEEQLEEAVGNLSESSSYTDDPQLWAERDEAANRALRSGAVSHSGRQYPEQIARAIHRQPGAIRRAGACDGAALAESPQHEIRLATERRADVVEYLGLRLHVASAPSERDMARSRRTAGPRRIPGSPYRGGRAARGAAPATPR